MRPGAVAAVPHAWFLRTKGLRPDAARAVFMPWHIGRMVTSKPMANSSGAARIAALLCCAAFTPAGAALLYKSVGPNGVLQFSDLPPEKGEVAERIRIPDATGSSATVTAAAEAGMPREDPAETDAAVARANARLDLAEHALAEARHTVVGDYDPLRLVAAPVSRPDTARLDFYKRDVLVARQMLLEVLKTKRKSDVQQATLTASNEWTPLNPGAHR
jgi:Domain of unknown function (DUF4124)